MQGKHSSDDLQYDPEIERTARANRKVVCCQSQFHLVHESSYQFRNLLNLKQYHLLKLIQWEMLIHHQSRGWETMG